MQYKINYRPGSMSFAEGFFGPKEIGPGYFMEADYEKAKNIVNNLLKEGSNIDTVEIGLDGDFDCCSDILYANGKFRDVDFWDSSSWAKTIIVVNFKDQPSRMYETWKKKK